jgi:HEAT repeat protein
VLRSDPEPAVRAAAGRALGRLGEREALPDLIEALEDASPDVRVVAAAALWRLPDPAAVPALMRRTADAESAVREWSAQALGVIGDSRATPEVARLLSDPERAVRVAAVLSLGRIGDGAALEPLVGYLAAGGRDEEEKEEVVHAIVNVQSPRKVEALFTLLAASEQDPAQRLRLLAALGQVADLPAAARLKPYTLPASPAPVRKAAKQAIAAIEARSVAATNGTPK